MNVPYSNADVNILRMFACGSSMSKLSPRSDEKVANNVSGHSFDLSSQPGCESNIIRLFNQPSQKAQTKSLRRFFCLYEIYFMWMTYGQTDNSPGATWLLDQVDVTWWMALKCLTNNIKRIDVRVSILVRTHKRLKGPPQGIQHIHDSARTDKQIFNHPTGYIQSSTIIQLSAIHPFMCPSIWQPFSKNAWRVRLQSFDYWTDSHLRSVCSIKGFVLHTFPELRWHLGFR